MKKVINIEDNIFKHAEIKRALAWNGISNIELAGTAEEGIMKIVKAINENNPYDILILDMHFPVNGIDDWEAGLYVLEELEKINCKVPTIICSSLNLKIDGVIGCIFYNKSRDLNFDIKEMLEKIK